MKTLTNIADITQAVRQAPGHTAHWYHHEFAARPTRWRWVYAAFERAREAGYIRPELGERRGTTVWHPVQK